MFRSCIHPPRRTDSCRIRQSMNSLFCKKFSLPGSATKSSMITARELSRLERLRLMRFLQFCFRPRPQPSRSNRPSIPNMDARKWKVLAKGLSGRGHSIRSSLCLRVQLQHHAPAEHVHGEYQGSCQYFIEFAGHGARTTACERPTFKMNGCGAYGFGSMVCHQRSYSSDIAWAAWSLSRYDCSQSARR